MREHDSFDAGKDQGKRKGAAEDEMDRRYKGLVTVKWGHEKLKTIEKQMLRCVPYVMNFPCHPLW